MTHRYSLSDFVSVLEDEGELKRISADVDSALEIAEITNRICRDEGNGPALLFENVRGHRIPVLTNLLGSRRRLAVALRAATFDEVARRIVSLIEPEVPAGWRGALKLVPGLTHLTKLPPKTVKTGACQQVVHVGRDVDLGGLPVPRCWPEESGPAITTGQILMKDPDNGGRSVGTFPLEVRDRSSLLVHWSPHHDGPRLLRQYGGRGLQMPVAVVLGGDPVCTYAANAPLPSGIDPLVVSGFLRGENIETVRCRTVDLEVPADAEIVLEGTIDADESPARAGPVGTPTGYYSLPEETPVLHVSAVTSRANPIFPAMVPGPPPREEYWFRKASERVFLPFVRVFAPEIIDIHLPRPGVLGHLAFVSIRKQYPQQARRVMNALWSLPGLMFAKLVVVVDETVDVHDEEQVWYAVATHAHPGRDTAFCEGPAHALDHATPVRGTGHRMGIDATRKRPEEGHPRPWPDPLTMDPQIAEMVTARWAEYGLDTGDGSQLQDRSPPDTPQR